MSEIKSIVPPKGDYIQFENSEEYAEKLKEWGLPATKSEYWYKDRKQQAVVNIKGYEVYGEDSSGNTIVIEFADGSLGCIHPAFLKEMQAASFGKIYLSDAGETPVPAVKNEVKEQEPAPAKKTATKKETKKPNKETPKKVALPDDKVHFTAQVKQFALSWNHFNEENDEVVVLENVAIQQDEPIEIGLAWCSHSKTLKKWELAPGDQLEFDGKIVKKKLPQGKDAEEEFIMEETVPYKINNPSKIQKS